MMAWVGLRQEPIYYDRDERAAGTAKYSFGRSLRLAVDGLVSFSDLQLRLATIIGAFVSIGSSRLEFGARAQVWGLAVVPGWVSLLTPLAFLGRIQLLVLGVLGTYLARIFQ